MSSPVCKCGKPCLWEKVLEYSSLLDRVDHYGEDSLTEVQQAFYHQKICVVCYQKATKIRLRGDGKPNEHVLTGSPKELERKRNR